jgi:hypothetical protein
MAKGANVRRLSIVFIVIAALVLVVGTAGCGTGAQSAGLSSADQSPQSILAQAMEASQGITSASGSYQIEMSFDVDSSKLPEEAKGLVREPMKASGTMVFGQDPQAVEFTLNADMAGQTTKLGMKLDGSKAWLEYMDQWYEAPPEMQQTLAAPAGQEAKTTEIQQLLSELAVDPATWMKDVRLVGEEKIGGTDAYHLAATPDVTKMMADLQKLMRSDKLMKIVDPSGCAGELVGSSASLPTAEDLQGIQTQLQAMFKELTADLWIAKDTSYIVKFAANATITPPPGENAAGVNAITLTAGVSLQDVNEPVSVEPPASAKPWSAFEQTMKDNPGMFMGPFLGTSLGAQ